MSFPRDKVLQEAIKRIGMASLARRLGVQRQWVYGWRRVPRKRLRAFAKATGLSLHQLRPDLYARNGKRI